MTAEIADHVVGHEWLLLHGTPLAPSVWDDVAVALDPWGSVWAPELTPAAGDPAPQRSLAAALIARCRESGRRVDVVGHSFGGQVALEMALSAPDSVRTLTMICARASPFPAFVAHAENVRRGVGVADSSIERWFTPAEVAANGPLVRTARAQVAAADPAVYATALAAIAVFDRIAAGAGVAVPTTLIAAELDRGSPPESMARLRATVPDAVLEVIGGAAHMSPFLDPVDLATRIRRAAARADPVD